MDTCSFMLCIMLVMSTAPPAPALVKKWTGKRKNDTSAAKFNLLVSDTLTLRCRRALDIELITWFMNNNTELSERYLRKVEGHRAYLSRGGKELEFDSVELRDSGTYTCKTANKTHHIFEVQVEQVQSLIDFRSPFNCMLAATLVTCLLFLALWIGKKRTRFFK